MELYVSAAKWIKSAWDETGSNFATGPVPAAKFEKLDVDDLAYPLKNRPSQIWALEGGELIPDATAKIQRVPFIAFALDEARRELHIQLHWAPRCGYGYTVSFDAQGAVKSQKMRWVS